MSQNAWLAWVWSHSCLYWQLLLPPDALFTPSSFTFPPPQLPRVISLRGNVTEWMGSGLTVEVVGWWLHTMGIDKPGAWLLVVTDDDELSLVSNLVTRLPVGVNIIAGVPKATTVCEVLPPARQVMAAAKELSTLPGINFSQAPTTILPEPTHLIQSRLGI